MDNSLFAGADEEEEVSASSQSFFAADGEEEEVEPVKAENPSVDAKPLMNAQPAVDPRKRLGEIFERQRVVKARENNVNERSVSVRSADEIPDADLDSELEKAEMWDRAQDKRENDSGMPSSKNKKVERSKSELMSLKWQAATGQKDRPDAYAVSGLTPFNKIEDENKEKIQRMKDFADGNPHLQGRVVDGRTVTPEQAALGESMVWNPDETVLDSMWADEARYLGIDTKDASRADGESRKDYRDRLRGLLSDKFEETVKNQEAAKKALEETHETLTDKIVVGGLPSVRYAGEFAASGALMKVGEGARLGFDVLSRAGLRQLFTKEGAKQFAKVAAKNLATDAAKAVPVTIANAPQAYNDLVRDEYGVNEFGNIEMTSKGDERGLGTAFKAAGASFVENFLENAVGEISRPLAGKVFKQIGMRGGPVGRAVYRTYQNYDRMTKLTGFGDIAFEELPEENVQYFFNDVLGWGKRDSEFEGVWNELKAAFGAEKTKDGNRGDTHFFTGDGQYTLGGQFNTALAMLMQMGIQAAVAGGKTSLERIDAKRDIGNRLEAIGLKKEQLKGMSLEQRNALGHFWNTLRDKPEKLKEALERYGGFIGAHADEMVRQTTMRLENDIKGYGVKPIRFTFQSEVGANGKPVPKFNKVHVQDPITGEWSVRNEMSDPASGVTIAETDDGGYEVIDDINLGRTVSVGSFDEASHLAHVFAMQNQKQKLDNARRREYMQRLLETKIKRNAIGFESVSDMYRFFKNAVNQGGFGGVTDLSQVFFTDNNGNVVVPLIPRGGPTSGGFTLADGSVAVILDNIKDPVDMVRVLSHESGHASGKADERARLDFLKRADPKSEYGQLLAQLRQRNEEIGGRYSDDYIVGEAFSKWLERRGHNPTIIQRLHANTIGKLGKVGDAELEVLANQIETESENGTAPGTAANPEDRISWVDGGYGPQRMEEPSEEAPTDKTSDDHDDDLPPPDIEDEPQINRNPAQTDNETPKNGETVTEKPVETPESGTSPESAENAPQSAPQETQPTSRLENVEGAQDAESNESEPSKPVLERNIIEKLTDKAEAREIPISEIEVSDSRIPQFKEGADPETGEVEPLTGEPYDLVSNPIVVMEFKDGKKVVVTGRHRYGLYKRSGRKTIAARVIREADGWTVKDAMAIDAIGNIIDEKGTEKDYVKYFDEAKPTHDEAKSAGFLDRPKGQRAFSIYEGATADTKQLIDWEGAGGDGKISVEQAGIISDAAPKDANPRFGAVQRVLVKKALDGVRGKKLAVLSRSLAEEAKSRKNAPKIDGEMQLDLFMSEEDQNLLALEEKRAEYRVKRANEYRRIAETLRTAVRKSGKLDLNEGYAKELGITDQKDRKQLVAARDKAVERANYWEDAVALDASDKAEMDAAIGTKPKGNLSLESATAKELKAEEKRRREKAEIEKRKNEPLKGGTGETGQTLMDLGGAEGEDLFNRTERAETPAPATPEKKSAVEKPKREEDAASADANFNDFPDGLTYEQKEALKDHNLVGGGENGRVVRSARMLPSFFTNSKGIREKNSDAIYVEYSVGGDAATEWIAIKGNGYSENGTIGKSKPTFIDLGDAEETANDRQDKPDGANRQSSPRKRTVVMKNADEEKKADDALAKIEFDTDFNTDSVVLSGDEIRKRMPGYNRLDWRTHVDRGNSFVAPRMEAQFRYLLDTRKGKGDGSVVILAGGNGAGKSTVAGARTATADFIIDSTLGNIDTARKQIDAILANGQDVELKYVYRPPSEALMGVVTRAKNGGHLVSPASFANSHAYTRKNLLLLADEYNGRISVEVFDNSNGSIKEISLEELAKKPEVDREKLKRSAEYVIGNAEKTLGAQASAGQVGSRRTSEGGSRSGPQEVEFSTEFDYEKFGKLVAGVGKLVDVLTESGHKDFKALATFISERDPGKYDRAKAVLQDVWNAVARQKGLERVSDAQADEVFGIIDKEAENGRTTGDNQRRDAGSGGSLGGALPPNDAQPAAEEAARGEGVQRGEGSAGAPVQGTGRGQGRDLGGDQGGRDNPAGGAAGRGEPGKGVKDSSADRGNDRPAVPVQQGKAQGEQRPASDGVDAGAQGREGGLDAGRSERGVGGADGAEPVAKADASVKRAAKKAVEKTGPVYTDFVMTPAVEDAILEKSAIKRVRNNVAAIKLLQELKERDFKATPGEQEILAKYVGWGGLSEMFSWDYERAWEAEKRGDTDDAKDYAKGAKYGAEGYEAYKEIRQTLNDEEYAAAKETVLTAFYTPIQMVRLEHEALRKLGVTGGRFLGPSAGVGNYASAAGNYAKGANWQFVEKDQVSGQILRALFPNQRVHIGGYEETKLADSFFDFAIDNVPYADIDITDKSIGKSPYKIHDYFFAKTLSKLRPGGVMMFLTSTGTLDKTDGKLRQFLSQNGGKIVGAVRLPNGFFSKNAGTDVASDLVIIQRVNGEADNTGFMEQQKYGTDTEYVRRQGRVQVDLTYNKYFADNPGQVIGEMKVGSGQYGRTMLEYKMPKGDMFAKVGEAIDNALSGIDREALMKSAPAIEQKDHAPVYDSEGLRQGNITLKGEKLYEKSGNELVEVEMPKLSAAQKKRIAGKMLSPKKIVEKIIGVRKALRSVVDAEVNGMDDEHLQPLIDNLNEAYDDFVKRVGTFHDKTVTPFIMLDKADGNRLMTMEKVKKVDGNDVIEKADILKKRVIFTYQKPTKADTLADALTISYSEYGYIRWDRIGELMGIPSDDVGKRLVNEGLAFENPQTGIHEPYWEYLSGHVRRKLEAARAAMQNDPAFAKNVEALEKVQPKDVSLDEVTIKFGNTWVDPDAMIDFLKEMYDIRGYQDVKLTKNETLKKWNLELPRSSVEPFGAITFTQEHFLQAVLNSESLEVRAKDPITEKYYVLERETEAQKLAAEKLHEAFARFLRTSEKWYEPSNRSFNLVMNDNVAMKLPNNILPLRAAGMSEDVIKKLHAEGREYQPAVIARGVLGGKSLCLAHCVGAGKTLEMQSIGMIGRHLGMFKKSMYVVPNHMLDQFCNEFLAAFPNANILKMSTEDVQPKNRRAFFAKVANGDWDAIVVKHSTFSQKLPMTEKWQKDYLEREVRRLTDAKLAAKGDKASAKDIEKMIVRAKEKIKKLDSSDKKDSEIVPFEELGVDQLFVDEAHNFKGLPTVSSQARKVKGLAQGDSQRALDMEMKTQYVQSLHDGKRGVVFATGTPLSNAPVVEAYVNLRYLAPWALEEQGISSFDDFVNTFGRIETESEFGIDGKSTKEVQRVTAFVNIPEMMRLFKSVVDIVNSDQIKVKRPKMVMEAVPVQMSDAQAAIMEMVANESAIPPTKEERSKFLTLSGIAKRACISPRLLGVDDDGSKMIACANKVKQVFDETSDVRGAQLIFTDIFNSSDADGVVKYVGGMDGYTGKKWNLNDHLKELLVRSGIPAEQIGVIHDVDKAKGGDEGKDAAKEALFAKVRSGEIRVLIGSRPRMGEGTNVQERLAAIHLLHPGWKPSEDTQAIGRIIRPGNIFESGKVFYYLTQGNKNVGSYETKNHELIGVKDRLIQAVMHGDETIREIDLDEASAERDMLMGLASANQDLIKLIDVKRVLHKAELNVESVGFSARSNADNATRTERALEKAKEDFAEQERGAKEWREKNADGSFVLTVPDGRKLDSMKDMAEYVSAQVTKQLAKDRYDRDERLEIGNFGGVPLILSCTFADNKIHISVPSLGYAKEISYSGFLADFSPQAMTAFKGRILSEVSPDMEDAHKQTIADTENRIKRLKADAERFSEEWQKEKEKLTKLRAEKERLERAVTPLLVQTTEDHKYTTYGNWAITKNGSEYKAVRQSDGKEIEAGTVKELLPKMDAEDFSAPGRGASKTVDLAPIVNKRGGEDKNPVKTVAADEVDFDTYLFDVFGPSGKETIEVNNAKSLKQARSRAIFRYFTGGERRDLTPQERGAYNDVDTYIKNFNNIPLKTVIIHAGEHADKYEAGLRKYLTEHPEVEDRARRLAVSRKDSVGNSGRVGRSSEPRMEGSGSGGRILPSQSRPVGGLTQGTFSDLGVDFDTRDLTPEESAYAEREDKTPTEDDMKNVFGMTNADIDTALRAAGMEPPRNARKPDATTREQAEVLLSRPEYMAKLSRAVYKVGRPVTDYENIALNVLFRRRAEEVNRRLEIYDEIASTPEDAAAKDPEFARMKREAKEELDRANALMRETAIAARHGATAQGQALRSNRFTLNKYDLSFAGITHTVQDDMRGLDIPPEMQDAIKKLADDFKTIDKDGRKIATARLKAFSEKVIDDIKRGGKLRMTSEKAVGDEGKRVMRNYLDALAQIEVHAAEAGGTLIGMVDQMYPSWGKWLKYLGEYHCYMNPEITEDEVIAAIVEDVSPFMDGVDANQVRDLLTGFGHNYRQSRYDSQRLMNDLRSQARMKRQLDYMNENNQLSPQTGMIRDEPSDEARRLAREVQERKKEIPEGGANRLKGLLESAKTRVKNRIADLERAIMSGEAIPRRERTVREDVELTNLKKRKDELQEQYDAIFGTKSGMTDEQRVKATEKALAKELERTMDDLARAQSGDFSKRPKRPGVSSATIESLREEIARRRQEILDLKKAAYEFGLTPEEIAARNAKKMLAREAAIIRMAERIERGDIRPMKKPQPPMPPEMQKAYDKMGEQLRKAHQKLAEMRLEAQRATRPAFWRKLGAYADFAMSANRALKATMDFSAVLRQAARMTLGHPKLAVEAFGKAWDSMTSDLDLVRVNDEILSDEAVREAIDKYGLHMRDVDADNDRDVEMFHGMERNKIKMFGREYAITDIPFFGKLMLKSERHYITYLNAISAEIYTSAVNDRSIFPGGATPWQKKMLCDMINMWNGSAAISKERRQAMLKSGWNNLFWAPGLAISRVQAAAWYDAWRPLVAEGVKNAAGDWENPSMAERKTVAKFGLGEHVKSTMAMLALGTLIKFLMADDDDWYQFGQADWFEKLMMLASPKVGNTTIDLTGGEMSVYRLAHDIATKTKKTGTGKVMKFGEGYKSPSTMDVIKRFAEGKLNPYISDLVAIWDGEDYTGQDFGWKEAFGGMIPLSVQDIKDQAVQNGLGKTLLTAPLTLLGAGGSTYDRKPYENAVNPFLEAKKEYDAVVADESIEDGERESKLSQMREDNPLLRDEVREDNPLLRDEVREDIAADLAAIRKDENRAKRMEKGGEEPNAELNDQIEQAKRDVLEKIRMFRR